MLTLPRPVVVSWSKRDMNSVWSASPPPGCHEEPESPAAGIRFPPREAGDGRLERPVADAIPGAELAAGE
jgi:hypothetical protein